MRSTGGQWNENVLRNIIFFRLLPRILYFAALKTKHFLSLSTGYRGFLRQLPRGMEAELPISLSSGQRLRYKTLIPPIPPIPYTLYPAPYPAMAIRNPPPFLPIPAGGIVSERPPVFWENTLRRGKSIALPAVPQTPLPEKPGRRAPGSAHCRAGKPRIIGRFPAEAGHWEKFPAQPAPGV